MMMILIILIILLLVKKMYREVFFDNFGKLLNIMNGNLMIVEKVLEIGLKLSLVLFIFSFKKLIFFTL